MGFEAMLKSSNPLLSSMDALFDAAERCDRVVELGAESLRLAMDTLPDLPGEAKLFANVHPALLTSPQLLEEQLGRLGTDAHRVVFELTERVPLHDEVFSLNTLEMIRSKGCEIAVDDFGEGYSALAMVADLRPQYIKLNERLVRNLPNKPGQLKVVRLLRRFADATTAVAIGAGVELEAERSALDSCGVTLMQGSLFANA